MSEGFQGACFLRTHLVDRLIHLGGDVSAIQDVQGFRGVSGDDVQIGLPPIRADERDERTALLAQPGEELRQALLLAILDDEQDAYAPA